MSFFIPFTGLLNICPITHAGPAGQLAHQARIPPLPFLHPHTGRAPLPPAPPSVHRYTTSGCRPPPRRGREPSDCAPSPSPSITQLTCPLLSGNGRSYVAPLPPSPPLPLAAFSPPPSGLYKKGEPLPSSTSPIPALLSISLGLEHLPH
jgi:hypothetical protein